MEAVFVFFKELAYVFELLSQNDDAERLLGPLHTLASAAYKVVNALPRNAEGFRGLGEGKILKQDHVARRALPFRQQRSVIIEKKPVPDALLQRIFSRHGDSLPRIDREIIQNDETPVKKNIFTDVDM